MRKRAFLALACLLAAACAAPGPVPPTPPPPPPPADNLRVSVEEAVGTPETDAMAYARVFLDGQEAGQTPVARRSDPKTWSARVAPGNHPLRVEYWTLPGAGDWEKLPDYRQPRERFVRVEPGTITRVKLRFAQGAKSYGLQVSREAAP